MFGRKFGKRRSDFQTGIPLFRCGIDLPAYFQNLRMRLKPRSHFLQIFVDLDVAPKLQPTLCGLKVERVGRPVTGNASRLCYQFTQR